MKTLFAFVFLLLLASCGFKRYEGPLYTYSVEKIVPDSLREKQATFIRETVSAASNQMTGGDYEDPEDVIAEARRTSKELYGVEIEGLNMSVPGSYTLKFIPVHQMNPFQKRILDSLKAGGRAKTY
jgi:hypothetical protein